MSSSRWIEGEPPRDGVAYILRFKTGVVSSGSFRYGVPMAEPQPDVKAWRCDCCGRFADPVAYMNIFEENDFRKEDVRCR